MALVNDWKADYYDIWLNMRFEILKNLKTKRTLMAIGISILLSTLFYFIPVLTGSDFPADSGEFLSSSMGYVSLILLLNAILFGSDAVNTEHYKKTALLIYPLPQRRSGILIGKFIVQLLTSWFVAAIYYLMVSIEVWSIYGIDAVTTDLLKSLLFSLLYMSALLGIAFFLSALVKSPALSTTLTFFISMMFFPILNLLLSLVDLETRWILSNYSGIITQVFRFPSDMFGPGHIGSSDGFDFYDGVLVCLGYTIISFIGTLILTLRKEV